MQAGGPVLGSRQAAQVRLPTLSRGEPLQGIHDRGEDLGGEPEPLLDETCHQVLGFPPAQQPLPGRCDDDGGEPYGLDPVGPGHAQEVVVVAEEQLDAVTGLSGSGPAYIYMVIEALIDGGVKMGLSRDIASKLAIQTVLGSAKLVKESGLHPAILRDQVTTPGGTAINAIHELESHGLRSMLINAVATATRRSEELSKVISMS